MIRVKIAKRFSVVGVNASAMRLIIPDVLKMAVDVSVLMAAVAVAILLYVGVAVSTLHIHLYYKYER